MGDAKGLVRASKLYQQEFNISQSTETTGGSKRGGIPLAAAIILPATDVRHIGLPTDQNLGAAEVTQLQYVRLVLDYIKRGVWRSHKRGRDVNEPNKSTTKSSSEFRIHVLQRNTLGIICTRCLYIQHPQLFPISLRCTSASSKDEP